MNYKVEKKIVCKETGEELKVGDEVSIRYTSGGGNGCCRITKITDTGFHFSAGGTMKIIIFIIIACTLFVAWSLCIV